MREEMEQKAESGVQDSGISRVNSEFAIGYDMDFENQWWRVEVSIWVFLCVLVLTGVLGLLGRGPLSRGTRGSNDSFLVVNYQRIARYKTPEEMTVRVGPELYRNGKIYLWLNRAVVEKMGLQRIIPQPLESMPGEDGIGYIFSVSDPSKPTLIYFAKEASSPGVFVEELKVDPEHDLFMRSVVLP